MLHTADTYPCLTVKAWNGRLLLVWLDVCLPAMMTRAGAEASVELRNAALAARALTAFYDRIERSPRYLSEEQAQSIWKYGYAFLAAYQRLAKATFLDGERRWRYIPKLHAMMHLIEDMRDRKVNCRMFHCMRDEDHVGLMKRLCQAVHKGALCEYRILTRFLLRLASWQPGRLQE